MKKSHFLTRVEKEYSSISTFWTMAASSQAVFFHNINHYYIRFSLSLLQVYQLNLREM